MNKRDVVRTVLEHQRPPYVPWSLGFTHEASAKLRQHFGRADDVPTAKVKVQNYAE